MKNFEVSSDSTCDLFFNEIKDLNVFVAPLVYTISKDDELVEETDNYTSMEQYENFYNRLKNGYLAQTSILNVAAHIELFTKMAEQGIKNAIHISQGYGLSPTLDNANAAIEEVKKKYPDINYMALEACSTTVGEGMLVRAAVKMRDEGASQQETFETLNKIKHNLQHFVLVNDLKFLARGGRIGKASANIGSLMQVKPIIEFNKQGKLEIVRKEIGAAKAFNSIVNEFGKFTLNEKFPYICIVHTGNMELAEKFQNAFKQKYNITPEIRFMGPIIGAHIGPSAVAICCLSNEERPY